MGIPLDKIITFDKNVYEMTSVAIVESQKLADDLQFSREKQKEKIVTQAIINTMNDEVEYTREK